MEIYKDFGVRLAHLRKEKGLSQNELSRLLDMPQSTYAGYETGNRKITLELIKKFALFFSVSPTYLVTGSNSPEKAPVDIILSSDETDLIKKYRMLDERGKKTIDTLLISQLDYVI